MEMGQRKKIIDDHDKHCSKIEISKLLSDTKIFQHRYKFSNISLMFVQTFRSYFSEEIFLSSLSEWLSAQVGVFPKEKTGKHKGEIKTHQRRKNWKAKKSKQQKQKNKYTQKVHLKTSCDNPLGN
jgi:hypothetical protein